jgi:hypothetical protein
MFNMSCRSFVQHRATVLQAQGRAQIQTTKKKKKKKKERKKEYRTQETWVSSL